MDAEDEEFEQKPLEGMLVEIYGLEAPLEPSLETKAAQPGVEPTDMNGARGRALGWSSKDRKYIVETFDGFIAGVAEENLREFPPQEPEGGGFDVAWPSGNVPPDLFAEEVLDVLSQKGYCMIQMFTAPGTREKAREEAFDLTQWHLTTKELEVPYMGYENSTKYANLEGDLPDRECEDALAQCDRTLTNLGVMLCPLIPEYLGFDVYARSNGMVRVPLMGPAEEDMLRPEPLAEHDYDSGGKVYGHLNFMKRRKLFLLYFVDNEGGTLTLHPSPDHGSSTPIEIPIQKNRLVVFRPDIMTYTYKPRGESLLLQTWYVTAPLMQSMESPKVVQLPVNQQNQRAHVQSIQMRFAGGAHGPETGWSMWLTGTDGAVKIPKLRWDIDVYYNPEIYGMSYTVHSACIDETVVQSFDNEFFKIPHDEANVMSPGARNLLEVGYHTLNSAGYTKQNVNGEKVGVYIGNAGTDWVWRNGGIMYEGAMSGNMSPWVNSGTNPGMINARISHNLGLKGPIVTCDTACSSSLVALGQAHAAMRQTMKGSQRTPTSYSQLSKAMVMGLCLDDGPQTFLAYCAATMLSVGGRSFTFDESANGFLRGEGIGGAFIKRSDSDEDANSMYACVIGCNVNQDGRSASMTAPNGPSQQICIKASMIEAGVSASQITIAECHGTGTALGDPIEVGALREVMKDREIPIIMTSAKANFGHMEACAGMGGISKCVLMLCGMTGAPNIHLRHLNPHIEHNGYPAIFISEMADCETKTGISGVSSFGVGGTNARGDMWGRSVKGPRKVEEVDSHKKLQLHSMFYARVRRNNGAGPNISDSVYIAGTWSAFKSFDEMEQTAEGEYSIVVRLGSARIERFRLVLNEDDMQTIYPASKHAGQDARVEGPDWESDGRAWRIDGRDEPESTEANYRITFEWGFSWERGERMKVSWQKTDEAPQIDAGMHEHTYSVGGTWTAWDLRPMAASTMEASVYETQARIGINGQEEFQIARDRDWEQAIYPAAPKTMKTSVPVRGPDSEGEGKHWVIRGPVGELVTIQVKIADMAVTVKVVSPSKGPKIWRSTEDEDWHDYYIAGTWNDLELKRLKQVRGQQGVHKHRMTMGYMGYEDFQIVLDNDWGQIMYPSVPGAGQDDGEVCMPDGLGEEQYWRITGRPGQVYEIVLNMDRGDGRPVVLWNPANETSIEDRYSGQALEDDS
eukprot:CAMPEP_0179212974 /NCGR_PEP_ID=MMETSP0797-20121207/1408_1 /TAXON_ID=47934 /ORGANISM="Dinophysis acuminata, Strain DAEP01" /LENGTH=1191 /DNA_ID=CAMNT_0020918655 /DNA_START=49 /DNA_END=3624 /DNA_ORIENTATION=-